MAKNTQKNYTNAVRRTIAFIEDNLERELCLDEIAAWAGYSKYHLNRLFSESVGTTISKYMQGRRLERAADRLVNTDEPITVIALAAGYGSQQAFTLAFRRVYQMTPGQYRIKFGSLTMRCAA